MTFSHAPLCRLSGLCFGKEEITIIIPVIVEIKAIYNSGAHFLVKRSNNRRYQIFFFSMYKQRK